MVDNIHIHFSEHTGQMSAKNKQERKLKKKSMQQVCHLYSLHLPVKVKGLCLSPAVLSLVASHKLVKLAEPLVAQAHLHRLVHPPGLDNDVRAPLGEPQDAQDHGAGEGEMARREADAPCPALQRSPPPSSNPLVPGTDDVCNFPKHV